MSLVTLYSQNYVLRDAWVALNNSYSSLLIGYRRETVVWFPMTPHFCMDKTILHQQELSLTSAQPIASSQLMKAPSSRHDVYRGGDKKENKANRS